MEIYKAPGKSGRVYHVFGGKTKIDDAIEEAARYQKVAKSRMKAVVVWIKGDDLYTEKVSKAKQAIAVVRR